MTSKEALISITKWIEYFTRLDYVDPIVRDEVRQLFIEAYQETTPELKIIEKDLERLRKQDKILSILKNHPMLDLSILNEYSIDDRLEYEEDEDGTFNQLTSEEFEELKNYFAPHQKEWLEK